MSKEKQIEEMARVIAEVQYLGGLEQKVAQLLFERGYLKKSEVEKAIQDGIRAFCEELEAEITADRDRAYDSITERNRRKESHLNDAFCIHEDGKLVALNGMLYSVHELLKKYTEEKGK